MSDLVEHCRLAAQHWQLQIGEPLVGGARSAVFAASDVRGRDLVLKLPAAGDNDNATDAEAAALSDWADSGAAATLVDSTPSALLLLRARPGEPMPWRPEMTLVDVVAIAGELLRRLWSSTSSGFCYPTLAEVYPANERVAHEGASFERRQRGEPDRGAVGLQRLTTAAAAAQQLIDTTPAATLLHGDFITKNLVTDAASPVGWVALDPLPMVGDPAAEVAAFAAYHPAEMILPIAEALAHEVAVDPRRVLGWTAIWLVHQAAQAWRDDQHELDGLVASTTIDRLLNSRPETAPRFSKVQRGIPT